MDIIRKDGIWKLFEEMTALILMDEGSLARIIENPSQPLLADQDKGFSAENQRLYDTGTSLVDICRQGQEKKATRLEVSYDFFFGGSTRVNYPDSEQTLAAYRVIHDTAREYGMGFGASVVSPLDTGGGYARTHSQTGQTCQYKEGRILPDGSYEVDMVLQTQWTNNKGPISLSVDRVLVYAFSEERIAGTPFYAVDPEDIDDISDTAHLQTDPDSIRVTFNGYGTGRATVTGKTRTPGKDRCLAVLVYRTPELDYFSNDALPYMKSIIDLHADAGITYDAFYSDEMHIQFDWDLLNHFGHDTEINTRYLTTCLAREYADKYGHRFADFHKYLVYFSYHQHDFLDNDEGCLPNQHVFGKTEHSIYETWRFKKQYFEMLQRRVVDLCLQTKAYAERVFQRPILAKGHATWQESPTCDRFKEDAHFSEHQSSRHSRYEYTPDYVWSSSIRENMSACCDYFKWNEYLTGGGTDHPEGGNLDRNYYGCAFACSLAVLNAYPISYYGFWGGPRVVMDALANIGITYGNHSLGHDLRHNLVQAFSPRQTDVLTLYPLDLNYVEERFGSWMVQYGYTNYITEDALLGNYKGCRNGRLHVGHEAYRTLVVLYSPFISKATLDVLDTFVHTGGKVLWSAAYPLPGEGREALTDSWKQLFGIAACSPAHLGRTAKGGNVRFCNKFSGIGDMEILTDMLPDHIYPVTPGDRAVAVAAINGETVGTCREYENGGVAVYLGFRPRDDQSGSTGRDVDTLFRILTRIGAYSEDSLEVMSRETDSPYLLNRFKNGAVSLTNHLRAFYEGWDGKYFRDEAADAAALAGRELPKAAIALDKFRLNGHNIKYAGQGVLTVHLADDGTLRGFAGNNTTGIEVNGRASKFLDTPGDIAWTEIPAEQLCEGIACAYAICSNQAATLSIPLMLADENGWQTSICRQNLFDMDGSVPYTCHPNHIAFDIDERAKGKWILLWRTA